MWSVRGVGGLGRRLGWGFEGRDGGWGDGEGMS